jgi:hypothetical protein
MNRSRTTRATRRRQALAALVCGPALLLASSVNVWAQAQDAVTRIEEDWVMVLVEPEAGRCSPQFHTTMSPRGDLDGTYVQMCWNYRDDPDFAAGGMQMHAWKQEDELRTRSADLGNFSNAAETARWTQVMELSGENLKFTIQNGSSSSWGSFGGPSMSLTFSRDVPNLNGYSSSVSRANSGISFGTNRVKLLAISQVRRYGQNGLISVDSMPKIVYQSEGG